MSTVTRPVLTNSSPRLSRIATVSTSDPADEAAAHLTEIERAAANLRRDDRLDEVAQLRAPGFVRVTKKPVANTRSPSVRSTAALTSATSWRRVI